MTGIACVPNADLIVVSTYEGVYIYENSTQREPIRVLDEHVSFVQGVVHLFEDIFALVLLCGLLTTWHAGSGAVLDQLRISNVLCTTMTKAGGAMILVGTTSGEIIIVSRDNGSNLNVHRKCTGESRGYVRDISVYNGIIVSVTERIVEIWNCLNGQRLHTIGKSNLSRAALSDELIVIGRQDGILYKYKMREEYNYNLLRTIDLQKLHCFQQSNPWVLLKDITFVTDDVVMVTIDHAGIFFVSLASHNFLSH